MLLLKIKLRIEMKKSTPKIIFFNSAINTFFQCYLTGILKAKLTP